MKPLTVTEEQALYFRASRGFLAQNSAATIADAASRIIGAQSQLLAPSLHLGHVCVAEKQGAEQSYAARSLWHGDLTWKTWQPTDAAASLLRDYLRVHGPATPHDVAHFFGARITLVREWIQSIEDEITPVDCGGRDSLILLSEDIDHLARKSPKSPSDWPPRLLPAYEAMLMAHADKSWTVPSESERKRVWRKSAVVAAVILDQGRVVATWTQKATKKKLFVSVQPLSAWRKTKHLAAVRREAAALARHLEVGDREVSVEA